MRFRRNVERIGELMAYEISKCLEYQTKTITTPLAQKEVSVLSCQPVVATILRAGLPYHQGFLNIFDQADCAFISAYREYSSLSEFSIKSEYIATPSIENRVLLIVDPMLATGKSLEACYEAILAYGTPSKIHIAAVIASQEAIDYLNKRFSDTDISVWCGAIDPSIDNHGYIVPGLGDAGDLCYGDKI